MAQIDKFVNLQDIKEDEIQKIIEKAPDCCLITGLHKIKAYIFDEGVVYGYEYPHDVYTLPIYSKDDKNFYRTKIDMDYGFRRQNEFVCELDELRNRPDFKEIKEFYGIKEE